MEDLLIIQKIEDMMRYGYQAVAHFPKSERHVMSQEIRLAMWRLMRGAVLCAKSLLSRTNDDGEYIFVKYITTRDGRRLYAWQYGLKDFRIKISNGSRK